MDKYFILWDFWKGDRKRKRKKALCLLGQNSRSAAGPAREAAQRTGARARARFKPDGRGPGVSEREGGDGGERLTGGARLSSLTPSPDGWRAHRRRCRARRGRARARLGSASCRRSGGGGCGRRGGLVRRRRGLAVEELRVVVVPVDSGCKRRGKGGGRSQGLAAVPDRAKGAAEEALTAQTPVTRGGGARLDPEHREGEGSWGSAGDR